MSTRVTGEVDRKAKVRSRSKRPSMYVVIVHNDDFTPRHFVVEMLRGVFGKTEAEATRIMLLAHNYGVGFVAKYPYEIAESKVDQCLRKATERGYPLMFSAQEE